MVLFEMNSEVLKRYYGGEGAQAVSKKCSRCSILSVGDDGSGLLKDSQQNWRNAFSRAEEKAALFVLTKIRTQNGLFRCRSLKTLLAKSTNLLNRSRRLRGIISLNEVPISFIDV